MPSPPKHKLHHQQASAIWLLKEHKDFWPKESLWKIYKPLSKSLQLSVLLIRKTWILQPLPQIYWLWDTAGGWDARCTESVSVLELGLCIFVPSRILGPSRGPEWGGEGSLGDWPGSPYCPPVPALSGTQLIAHRASLPRWLLNLFHHQIESKFRRVLESKVRMSKGLALPSRSRGWAQVLNGLWPWTALGAGPGTLGLKAQRGQIKVMKLVCGKAGGKM